MKEVSSNVRRMQIYVNNVHDIYLVFELLTNCVTKRVNKGLEVSPERLLNSSAIYKIARMAANAVYEHDGEKPTREEKKELRQWLTDYVIECANV